MNLYLMRHANAGLSRENPLLDAKRSLVKEGKEQCILMARALGASQGAGRRDRLQPAEARAGRPRNWWARSWATTRASGEFAPRWGSNAELRRLPADLLAHYAGREGDAGGGAQPQSSSSFSAGW
jgi:hypothetical protein